MLNVAYAHGSDGSVPFDRRTGYVLPETPMPVLNGHIYALYGDTKITRFDVDEHRAFWRGLCDEVETDICDLGYWYLNEDGIEEYSPPVMRFRMDVLTDRYLIDAQDNPALIGKIIPVLNRFRLADVDPSTNGG